MKVVCINNKNEFGFVTYCITPGKSYDCWIYNKYYYYLKNDIGNDNIYYKHLFVSIKEYRKQKLIKIGDR